MKVIRKYSDSELIDAINSPGEMENAIKYIYREHYQLLKVYVLEHQGSDEDAQDIFQEVIMCFVDMVQGNKFRGESSIKTLLYSLNRNIWTNHFRKKTRSSYRDTVFEAAQENITEDVTHAISKSEAQKEIWSTVGKLGEACKTILLAFYYENLSMKEILTKLPYENEQVVRNKKSKCLRQLQELFKNNPLIQPF